ncbi:MAG TPA: sensor histidine kinase [Opitutaceae bacterium]|nr:sensor histidine kinase [Opitutaceae bacterium]
MRWPAAAEPRALVRLLFALGPAVSAIGSPEGAGPGRFLGLPVTRLYSYEEISSITRANYLAFDPMGRLAAIRDGAYVVLNDTAWLDLAEPSPDGVRILQAICDRDGAIYFGGLGIWGKAVVTPTGMIRPVPFRAEATPEWVHRTNFTDILCRAEGVYFRGFNGVVFWDRQSRRHAFLEVVGFRSMFVHEGQVHVSSDHQQVMRLVRTEDGLATAPVSALGSVVIEHAVPLTGGRLLLVTNDRRFLVHAEGRVTAWPNPLAQHTTGRVSALEKLIDGDLAVSIVGSGLYIVSEEGAVRVALNAPEYQSVMDLANNEAGVLWAAAETGVVKVLYGGAVTLAGPTVGLPVSWPQVVASNGRIFIATAGRLYEAVNDSPAAPTRFRFVPTQPAERFWAIAAVESGLLVGNANGVFLADDTLQFSPVLAGMDVARLVAIGRDLCFAIGATEITALRRENGRWHEFTPRVPGVGYPSVVHATARAVWIELGANRVARIALGADGLIRSRLFDRFPWTEPTWVNLSVLGDVVVFTGSRQGRAFFNDAEETFTASSGLEDLFAHMPHWVARISRDEFGDLWASHRHGMFRIPREPSASRFDMATCDVIKDAFPLVQFSADGRLWASSGESLYHIDRSVRAKPRPAYKPTLISVRDRRTNRELFRPGGETGPLGQLSYDQNSVDFRFFAGSYASRRPPHYEFRVNHEPWTSLELSSVLTLSDLREGAYQLEVRTVENGTPAGGIESLGFVVTAPWYRSRSAYAGYAVACVLLVFALFRAWSRRARSRNLALARLVEERTSELKAAMRKLNDETRVSATLAERQRLAFEIHDSVQQSLSGLMWQLDTTLNADDVHPAVRSRLGVARSMASFARQEVQNAVCDMESPLLEGTGLAGALGRLTELIDTGIARVEMKTAGQETRLSQSVQHHLLRIVQEAITNALRHGAADRILIELEFRRDVFSLAVRDNGRGFDPDAAGVNHLGHLGLRSMRTRSDKIGALLRIDSAVGRGTTVTIRLPLQPPP